MTQERTKPLPKSYFRTAGALYLAIAACGIFSIGYVPSVIIESGDAAATASNLAEHGLLSKLGLLADIILIWIEVVLTSMLFVMFNPINRTLSTVAMMARAGMIIVMGVNLIFSVMPMVLHLKPELLAGFETPQIQSVAMMLNQMHDLGVYAWQIFFGLHLVALGLLVIKSGIFPSLLGWMMLVGSQGYLLQAVQKFLFIDNVPFGFLIIGLLAIVTIGELSFAFYLLIRGFKSPVKFS